MLLPVRDINQRVWVRYHYVTLTLVGLCVVVFLLQIAGTEQDYQRALFRFGVIPAVLLGDARLDPALAVVPGWLTPLTSLFLHGDIMHLAGNMLFLWVFGDNVEDSMGHGRFLVFYLICGVAAAFGHVLSEPASEVPTIGASGAISGILGAYFVLHPRVKIWVLAFIWLPLKLPAFVVLGLWAALQVVQSLFGSAEASGVAWWAHLTGFIAGAALIPFFKYPHVTLFDTSETGAIKISGLRLRERRGGSPDER